MKLVTINNSLLLKYHEDPEVLQKSTRPYVLVIRLKYRNTNYDFAIPIRSNIPASAPKNQYFALPPRPQTRPKNRHGLHYIKMFPVTKQYLIRYRTDITNCGISSICSARLSAPFSSPFSPYPYRHPMNGLLQALEHSRSCLLSPTTR